MLKHEVQASPGRVRRPRPAGHGMNTADRSRLGPRNQRIQTESFTIDGKVVLGPDGPSCFEELGRREAARTAVVYALDLIERDGEDLRDRPFLDRKAALARLLGETDADILLNEHVAEDGPTVLPAGLVQRASSRRRSTGPIGPVRAQSGSQSAIRTASLCSGNAARIGIDDLHYFG